MSISDYYLEQQEEHWDLDKLTDEEKDAIIKEKELIEECLEWLKTHPEGTIVITAPELPDKPKEEATEDDVPF